MRVFVRDSSPVSRIIVVLACRSLVRTRLMKADRMG